MGDGQHQCGSDSGSTDRMAGLSDRGKDVVCGGMVVWCAEMGTRDETGALALAARALASPNQSGGG